MNIPDLTSLEAMRLAGKRPAGPVWLWLGDYAPSHWEQWGNASVEINIPPAAAIERLDLRPLVSLRLIVVAPSHSNHLMRLLARLKDYAESIDCFVIDWMPDDLGMRWERGQAADWIAIGDKKTENNE